MKAGPSAPGGTEDAVSGNALFLILIAVALFAALAYAVTQSGRGGSSGVGAEKASLEAARLLQIAAGVQAAYNRMVVVGGCNMDAIEHNTLQESPAIFPGPCNIFDRVDGGGVDFPPVPPSLFGTYGNPPYPGTAAFMMNSMDAFGVAGLDPDDIFFVFNIKPETCRALNLQLGIPNPGGEPPLEDTPYEGGWFNPRPAAAPLGTWGLRVGMNEFTDPAGNELEGKATGCFRADRVGTDMGYHFYHVLRPL